jgi:hypothetical protein
MSEIYKEAIVEAKKLKEIAEIDAKNKIIEAVTPFIKKIIASEASEANKFLFGEEDTAGEPGLVDPALLSGQPNQGAELTPPPSAPLPAAQAPAIPAMSELPPIGGNTSNSAPISPASGLLGMPMPDDEGKITVDFQQLFTLGTGSDALSPGAGVNSNVTSNDVQGQVDGSMGGEGLPGSGEMAPIATGIPGSETVGQEIIEPGLAPEEEPLPSPPITGESRILKFQNDVRVVAEKIDYLYFRGNVPLLVKESLKSKLFTLCENLDEMVNEEVVSSKKARLAENKLEFLFMKLNEAEHGNSYKEIKGASMTTLREFAAKLFEEDALGPATADKATAHAEKVSGVQPGVDLFKENEKPAVETKESEDIAAMTEALLGEDAPASSAFGDGKLEGDAENKSPKVHAPDALAKEKGAGIVESAPASSAFGNGEKAKGAENTSTKVHKPNALADEPGANSILEFDEKELREAIASLRKENLSKKLAAVKSEAALKGTDKDGHLKTPSVPEGDQGSAKPEGGKDPAQAKLKECDMEMENAISGDSDMDALEMGAGSEGSAADDVELTFQIDVDDLEALLNGAVESSFVAEPSVAAAVSTDDDTEIEVVDDDTADSSSDLDGQMLMDTEKEKKEMPMESKKPAGKSAPLKEQAVIAKAATAVKTLKTQLVESQLLTAKALYVSKFAVRDDLTKKQKQKIAEYFDKAKTITEAKETYVKIKKILSENAPSSAKLSGSASMATSSGSATLNESVGPNASGDQVETQRWMLLAGIKSKK